MAAINRYDPRDMAECRCGHVRMMHLHYSPGTRCSFPGCACPRFQRKPWWARLRTVTRRWL